MRLRLFIAFAVTAAALVLPARAVAAPTGGREIRTRVACLGGTVELRLRIAVDDNSSGGGHGDPGDGEEVKPQSESSDDDEGPTIGVELRASVPRPALSWRVVLLHERQLVYKGRSRPTKAGYAYRLRRAVPNWPGQETVTARLTAPSGRVCQIRATI